jgi:flagellar biogenesis protein FliO
MTVLVSALHRSTAHHAAVSSTTADVSVGHVFLQMILALGVVVGGVWGVGKMMGRSSRRSGSSAAKRGAAPLTVLSRQSLGKGLAIAAVQWGDREVLVGIAGSTITFLDDPRSDPDSAPPGAGTSVHADRSPLESDPLAGLALAVRSTTPTRPAGPELIRPSFIDSLRAATARR